MCYFGYCSTIAGLADGAGKETLAGFAGSGPLAVLRLVSSFSPWANKHLSPYLQVPFSRQFLHISYFNRLTMG